MDRLIVDEDAVSYFRAAFDRLSQYPSKGISFRPILLYAPEYSDDAYFLAAALQFRFPQLAIAPTESGVIFEPALAFGWMEDTEGSVVHVELVTLGHVFDAKPFIHRTLSSNSLAAATDAIRIFRELQ